ncbi:MAG: hypothetical protein ACTHZ9_05675 [Leucobacter sp.]
MAAGSKAESSENTTELIANHFRSVSVFDLPPDLLGEATDELPLRIPLMAGDIYSDVDNPERLHQLLRFGMQNLYDPNLDEWIFIDNAIDEPGEVALPAECIAE